MSKIKPNCMFQNFLQTLLAPRTFALPGFMAVIDFHHKCNYCIKKSQPRNMEKYYFYYYA